MPRVYIGIGSNVERETNIRSAVRALRKQFGEVDTSTVYQSRAEGFDGEDFYNLVATFATNESIETLRNILADIETAHGRLRAPIRFGPRTLDIDILLYDNLIRHEEGFDVPRGEIMRCAYVLRPLAELAPDLRHPETGERLADLWQRYATSGKLKEVSIDLASDD